MSLDRHHLLAAGGTDGDGDGIAAPWSIYDAIQAAARYLIDLGARDDPRSAAKHYNAGPNNSNPITGEGCATRTIELMVEYHGLAGYGGPGARRSTCPRPTRSTAPAAARSPTRLAPAAV